MTLEKNGMVQAYLDTVSSHIKWREVHRQVKSELLSHLEEVVLELRNDGFSEQEAVTEAIHRMGDAADLGQQLQQTHVPQKNWPLVANVALLSGLGMTLIYIMEMSGLVSPSLHVFIKSLLFTGLGVVMLLWLQYYDFRKVRPYATYLYASTILIWFIVLLFGTSFVQMTWHVLMSLGWMPTVSMSFPFISFGGSQTIIHMGAIGAILSIYKRKNLLSFPD